MANSALKTSVSSRHRQASEGRDRETEVQCPLKATAREIQVATTERDIPNDGLQAVHSMALLKSAVAVPALDNEVVMAEAC